MRGTWMAIGFAVSLCAVLAAGCSRDQPKKKYHGPIDGTAEAVNPQTNEVSMKLVHPGYGVTVTRSGYVNEKTQVEVNGVTARVEDIRPGDPVRVTGYYEGADNKSRFIVTRISVRQANEQWIKVGEGAASAPASQPGR